MRKVYICSPYRAKDGAELDRNIDYAQQLTRQALEAGYDCREPYRRAYEYALSHISERQET